MTFLKVLWGIFWCLFCKHLQNIVAMVTTFFKALSNFSEFLYSVLRMPCKQYFLNYFGQNKGYHGLLQLFSVNFIFLNKAMNSGKKSENS